MSLSDRTARFGMALVLLVVALVAFLGTRPPAALSANVAPEQFSATRAMQHLAVIAARPHPIGTEANRAVRDYLVATLQSLGGDVRVEKTVGLQASGRFVRGGSAENIVAHFPGTTNSRAILLVAHYDSVSEAPGAADDGAGLISILETIRALRSGPPLRNDLVVLFSDGEEPGLLGTTGFVADHPELAARVGVLINLEARGSSGPALMFETSEENGWLVRELARVAPHPMASSLMYAAYKLMPNDTDLSVLKRTGVPALNFAFTETLQGYHSRLDTRENLSARSVQQMGANTLALVRRWGDLPLTDIRKPDCVYFNSLGHRLVVYPEWMVWPLAGGSFGLLAAAWVRGRRRGFLRRTFRGVLAFFVALSAIAVGLLLPWELITILLGDGLMDGDTPSNQLIFVGLVLVGFSNGVMGLRLLSAKAEPRELQFGMLIVAAVVATGASAALPGASYVFQWPVIFGAAGLLFGLGLRTAKTIALASFLPALPVLLIMSPLTYLFFANLGLGFPSLLAVSILLTLLLAAAWPIFEFILRRGILLLLAGAGLGLILGGAALSRPSAQHPQRDFLLYALNVEQGKAKWISYDRAPDQWTRQFLGTAPEAAVAADFNAGSDRSGLMAEAPVVALAAPVASVLSDAAEGGMRILRLHLTPPAGARSVLLRMPAETDLESVAIGKRVQTVHATSAHPWAIRYEAVPREGLEMELRFRGQARVKMWLASSTPGLPEAAMSQGGARPIELMPALGSDVTLVTREYNF